MIEPHREYEIPRRFQRAIERYLTPSIHRTRDIRIDVHIDLR